MREKLLIDLCGHIENEKTSVRDRAVERSQRYDNYSDKRQSDGDKARENVKKIGDCIPFGQPILIGHHSQRRAERDHEKMEKGRQKAVEMWKASDFWKEKAQDVIHHADYKDRADVRQRRIKKLKAESRKFKRNIDKSERVEEIAFYERWAEHTDMRIAYESEILKGQEINDAI